MADIDFDAVLSKIGERGWYQNRMYLLLMVPATIPAAFLAFNQVFVSAIPEHWCSEPTFEAVMGPEKARELSVPFTLLSDGTREFSRCEMYDTNFTALLADTDDPASLTPDPSWNRTSCRHGWSYDRSEYAETLVSQFDLVCDKSWWVATSTTCYCIGSVLGNCLMSMIGDWLGRRKSLMLVLTWHITFSLLTTFLAKDYVTYTLLRALNGLVSHALYQVSFVHTMELMGPSHRSYAGMMMCVYYALAMALLALISMVVRHWYWLQVVTYTPCSLLLSYYWLIPESPRWLLSKGRIEEAEAIIQKMAKDNGKPVPPNYLLSTQAEQARLAPELSAAPLPRTSTEHVSLHHMLHHGPLRRLCMVIPFVWLASAVVYNGLIYNSVNLGVSDQLGFLVSAFMELLSYLTFWSLMDRLGRRLVVSTSMLVGGLACVLCGFVPHGMVWMTMLLAMVGKFCTSGSFGVFYVFAGELLPTVVRSQAIAFSTFVGNFGQLTFPSIVHLATYNPVLPLLVFGTFSLVGALASALLPETLGRPLSQTLQNAEDFMRRSRREGLGSSCLPFVSKQKPAS